jgi:tRNA modification GTPase
VVLLVLDGSRPLSEQDELTIEAVEAARAANGHAPRLVVAINKSDLPQRLDPVPVLDRLQPAASAHSSTLALDGVESIRAALESTALGGARQEFVVGNVRHQDALRRAATALRFALDGLDQGTPLDLVSFDVRAATQALGEITGQDVDDELLDRIFRDFCIGK